MSPLSGPMCFDTAYQCIDVYRSSVMYGERRNTDDEASPDGFRVARYTAKFQLLDEIESPPANDRRMILIDMGVQRVGGPIQPARSSLGACPLM